MNCFFSEQAEVPSEEFFPEIFSNREMKTQLSSAFGCPVNHLASRISSFFFLEHHSKVPAHPLLVPVVQNSLFRAHWYSYKEKLNKFDISRVFLNKLADGNLSTILVKQSKKSNRSTLNRRALIEQQKLFASSQVI